MKYISFYKRFSILLFIISHVSLNAMDQQHENNQTIYESDEDVCCAGLAIGFWGGLCTFAVSSVVTVLSTSCCGVPANLALPAALGSAGAGACIGCTCGFHVGSCCCTNRGRAQVKKWFSNPLRYACRNN
jgi:hypothetical protein